jgi:hypothetical protein
VPTEGPKPIPFNLRGELSPLLDGITDPTVRWKIRRAVENAYAQGYADGHNAGRQEAREDLPEPKPAPPRPAPGELLIIPCALPEGGKLAAPGVPEGLVRRFADGIRAGCYTFTTEYPDVIARASGTLAGPVVDVDAAALAAAMVVQGRDPETGKPTAGEEPS